MAKNKHSIYDNPPRRHVLLLSCMDQRLLDETVGFMNDLNLHNRYDHLTLAGGSMGAAQLFSNVVVTKTTVKLPWKKVFFDHLDAAINTLKREIKDVFLLEHLDCGAYKELYPSEQVKKEYKKLNDAGDFKKLAGLHAKEMRAFTKEIQKFCREQARKVKPKTGADNRWQGIRVHSFLMDLLGDVHELT